MADTAIRYYFRTSLGPLFWISLVLWTPGLPPLYTGLCLTGWLPDAGLTDSRLPNSGFPATSSLHSGSWVRWDPPPCCLGRCTSGPWMLDSGLSALLPLCPRGVWIPGAPGSVFWICAALSPGKGSPNFGPADSGPMNFPAVPWELSDSGTLGL